MDTDDPCNKQLVVYSPARTPDADDPRNKQLVVYDPYQTRVTMNLPRKYGKTFSMVLDRWLDLPAIAEFLKQHPDTDTLDKLCESLWRLDRTVPRFWRQ